MHTTKWLAIALLAVSTATAEPPKKEPQLLTRAEFEKAVRRQTQAEIVRRIGKPDATKEQVPEKATISKPGGKGPKKTITLYYNWWEYKNRVINPATDKPYDVVKVRFDGGLADRIVYP